MATRTSTQESPARGGAKTASKKKVAKKKAASKKVAKKAASQKTASKKAASKKTAKKTVKKAASKKVAKKAASKKAASKKVAKKAASKKAASKKTASKKTASKKTASKKVAKKTASKKVAKKTASKKAASKKTAKKVSQSAPPSANAEATLERLHVLAQLGGDALESELPVLARELDEIRDPQQIPRLFALLEDHDPYGLYWHLLYVLERFDEYVAGLVDALPSLHARAPVWAATCLIRIINTRGEPDDCTGELNQLLAAAPAETQALARAVLDGSSTTPRPASTPSSATRSRRPSRRSAAPPTESLRRARGDPPGARPRLRRRERSSSNATRSMTLQALGGAAHCVVASRSSLRPRARAHGPRSPRRSVPDAARSGRTRTPRFEAWARTRRSP
ncbi:MAG: hypothetical protein R3A51_21780 [Nannocystaceae bacterium]